MIRIAITFDNTTIDHLVRSGTTPGQLLADRNLTQMLGVPANAQALVHGTQSNLPLNEGDHVTFIAAPSMKA